MDRDSRDKLRKDTVCEVASQMPGIGKTGMMKVMYFLQQVYKVSLEYDFDIYTYGPYDEDVLVAIGDAEKDEKGIDVKTIRYDNGITGYEITSKEEARSTMSKNTGAIEEISQHFSGYTAKKWELTSTILYLHVAYFENKWDFSELFENVRGIKPHFSIQEIEKEWNYLKECGFLDRAVSVT